MMSFGQGFPLPFSRYFSLRILFFLPSIKPRRQYHHQEKEQRSVIFPSIHASNSWNFLLDTKISVKFPEKHVKTWVVHFLLLFFQGCVEWYVALDIRLDPFFSESLQHICFFLDYPNESASWHVCLFFLGDVSLISFFKAQFFSPKKLGDLHVILPLGIRLKRRNPPGLMIWI